MTRMGGSPWRQCPAAISRATTSRTSAAVTSGHARFGHLEGQVAGQVAEQVLEVLIASLFPEGGANEQVPDPGAAEIEGDERVQLVPRPGRAGLSVNVAKQGDEHRELAEQGNPGKGQRLPV